MRYSLLLFLWALLGALAQPAWADAPTGTVTGTVRDAAGNPVPGAFLSLTVNQDINVHYWADAQGHFSIPVVANLPVGPLCASTARAGTVYSACTDRFTVAPGATLVQNLTLLPEGSAPSPGGASAPSAQVAGRGWIFGVVAVAGTKTPVAGTVVAIANSPVRTQTTADGTYQFPAMSTTDGANGGPTYTVGVTPPAGYSVAGPASQTVTVQADHGAEADFTLQPVPCQFVLGFKTLHDAIPAVVGACADDEQHIPTNGDALQHTAHGLLVWRKADNFTAFTDGYHTWVNGPNGVRERLNDQRFPWEANPTRLPVIP